MKYLLPEWHDLVDRKYDFVEEKNSEEYKADRFTHGARLWHILSDVRLDGVLVSRSIISPKLLHRVEQMGIRIFLDVPKRFEVLADCGAWQYIRDPLPKYKPLDVLEFYARSQVDAGVTVDHIAVAAKAKAEQEFRMQITYKYALEMFEEWKRRYREQFDLLGAVQGIEINDYINFITKLYNKGFTSFALGGLAKRNDSFIKNLIGQLVIALKNLEVQRIHFLGVARLRIMPYLQKLENILKCEASTDSATAMRMAWMKRNTNYLTLDGKAYIAIRVPPSSLNDKEVMSALRNYDKGKISFEEIWQTIKKFVITNGGIENLQYYQALLRDKPWEKCPCKVCQEMGIEITIFRGNERNRRRGFHNVWVFCNLLKGAEYIKEFKFKFKVMKSPLNPIFRHAKELSECNPWLPESLQQMAVLTYCTEQKNVNWSKVDELLSHFALPRPSFNIEEETRYRAIKNIPLFNAENLYLGSFRVIKRAVEALRKEGVQVDVFFISARYGVLKGDDNIIPYDATLANKSEEWIRNWSIKLGVEGKLKWLLTSKKYDVILVNLTKDYYIAIRELIKELLSNDRVVLILPKTAIDHFDRESIKAWLWEVKGLRERNLRLKHILETLRMYAGLKRVSLLKWIFTLI
ncbi:MAG: tRNA-guanine transglycosylase DpdA [Candidatus Bathyarchaeia archaeon]